MSNGGTRLLTDLTALTGQISRYVLRHLDAEAKRAVPTGLDDERALGLDLIRFGTAVIERAEQRQHLPQANVSAAETNKQHEERP